MKWTPRSDFYYKLQQIHYKLKYTPEVYFQYNACILYHLHHTSIKIMLETILVVITKPLLRVACTAIWHHAFTGIVTQAPAHKNT